NKPSVRPSPLGVEIFEMLLNDKIFRIYLCESVVEHFGRRSATHAFAITGQLRYVVGKRRLLA
ncbi:hypothetical protein ACPXBI_28520, partial [Escherichia coli]|uniref:hypothetical protein n=1 Tax=Escherichia coli TaxID=562 RepID=UPI003CE566C0